MKQFFTRMKMFLPALLFLVPLGAQNCYDVGTGADGAYSATANTTIAGGTYNFTTFDINSGVTVQVTGTQPLIILCTGAVTINGALRANGPAGTNGVTFVSAGVGGIGVAGGANGGDGSYSTSVGPLPGVTGTGPGGASTEGGGWSGGGGAGHSAVGGSSGGVGGFGGAMYGNANINANEAGSGGGGGSGGYSCGSGGGGAGGGFISITSGVSITTGATGVVSCNGGAGGSDGTGNCGGGGGGSGGSIWLSAISITHNGNLSCAGGIGGASNVPGSPYFGTGANGSTGRIRLDYNGTLSGTGTSTPAVGAHFPVVGPLVTAASATNVLCFGGNDGTGIVTASGGVPAYTYSWAPTGGTSSLATGLTAGTYTCTITDANGCSNTETVTITEPTQMIATPSVTNVDCNGSATGSASVMVIGGTPGYTYLWSPGGGTNATESNLVAGTYNCTITDANGCNLVPTITITEPNAITIDLVSAIDPTTCGGSDGAINISVNGGTGPYTYNWSNAATTEDLTGLPAGSYTCNITDAAGCAATFTITLADPALPVVTVALAIDTACQTTQAPFTLSGGSPAGGTYSGPGVTAGVFDPMQASIGFNVITYSYTDPNTNCSAASMDSVWVDICSGMKTLPVLAFDLYPNPTGGQFTITLGEISASPVTVEITNAIGQRVMAFTMNSNVKQVDLVPYENGLYLVRITNSESSSVVRVVKK